MNPLTIILHTHAYAIVQLPPGAPIPSQLATAPSIGIRSITRTDEETSIVCLESEAPKNARVELGWRAFQVKGPLDFNLTGILASLSGTLAAAGISLFAVSTFNTDYILVRDHDCRAAWLAFHDGGHKVEQTESV
jgi:uncharacterized protein